MRVARSARRTSSRKPVDRFSSRSRAGTRKVPRCPCSRLTTGRWEAVAIARRWSLSPALRTIRARPRDVVPADVGPHGCTIVEVLASRQVRLRFVSCETARWQHERVLVAASAPWEDLEEKLAERLQDLRAQAPSGPLLVRWTLVATDVAEGPTVWRELSRANREVVA